MAQAKIVKAVATFEKEHTVEIVDRFHKFIGEKVELDEEWNAYFEEFKKQQAAAVQPVKAGKKAAGEKPVVEKADKPKRAPTAYNIFIGEKMAELKEKHPEMPAKDRMKMASSEWKAQKEVNPLPAVAEEKEDDESSDAPAAAAVVVPEPPKKGKGKAAAAAPVK